MAEIIACLRAGKVFLLRQGQPAEGLSSPYQARAAAAASRNAARVVGITRGRVPGQLGYSLSVPEGTAVFVRAPGAHEEQRLFLALDARITDLDFSFGDEALACTVEGPRGTSAIGALADDGKGVRTVTEGDVIDRSPRWAPGGRGEIVYASAGIGRTKSGAWGGLAPSCVNRLRFADSSVEVLLSDARYDYLAPIASSEAELYAIRRPYRAPRPARPFAALFSRLSRIFASAERSHRSALEARDLIRNTPQGMQVVARSVAAFDVATNGDVVYATGRAVFRLFRDSEAEPTLIAELPAEKEREPSSPLEQLVIF